MRIRNLKWAACAVLTVGLYLLSGGGLDAFVAKFDSTLSHLLAATLLGGELLDTGRLGHGEEGDLAAGVESAQCRVAQGNAHLLGLVDDDEEDAFVRRMGAGRRKRRRRNIAHAFSLG